MRLRVRRLLARLLLTPAPLVLTATGCGRDVQRSDTEPIFPPAPITGVQTVARFPHDTSAFTQGLVFANGVFYESTGRYGQSTLRKVEVETGRVLQSVKVDPRYFAEGLTLFEGKLYQLTWQSKLGLVYDTATLGQTGSFPLEGEGWGLTSDGRSLIVSDGTSTLRFLDPRTFALQRAVDVRDASQYITQLNELEWVRGEVWANVWHTNRIARIDPDNGQVVGWLDLEGVLPPGSVTDPEAVLNGIAYDERTGRLFVTGKLWPAVFEIRVPGLTAPAPVSSTAAPR